MIYKLTTEQLQQVRTMNETWLSDYRVTNPDNKATGYASAKEVGTYHYIIKDSVTEQYITDYVDIVEVIPESPEWHTQHSDKLFQIILTEKQAVQLILLKPDFAGLVDNAVYENNYVYIYVNYIEDTDRMMLETNNIIINENGNN